MNTCAILNIDLYQSLINLFQNGNNIDHEELAEGEVSPSSLRRSTRVSALKAQEKLKVKEGMGLFPEVSLILLFKPYFVSRILITGKLS